MSRTYPTSFLAITPIWQPRKPQIRPCRRKGAHWRWPSPGHELHDQGAEWLGSFRSVKSRLATRASALPAPAPVVAPGPDGSSLRIEMFQNSNGTLRSSNDRSSKHVASAEKGSNLESSTFRLSNGSFRVSTHLRNGVRNRRRSIPDRGERDPPAAAFVSDFVTREFPKSLLIGGAMLTSPICSS